MLGPWNTGPNLLQAITAGADTGTRLRAQDIARSEAASRLQMAYAQLAAEENRHASQESQRMQLADAANALKARQINMLENWHRASVDARLRGIDSRQQESEAKLRAPEVHFGTQGEVTMWDPVAQKYSQVVPPRPIPGKKPTLSIPMDPRNPFGAKITGPADDPAVQDALHKALTPATTPSAPEGPSLGNRVANFFGLGGPKTPAPAAAPMPGEIAPIGSMPGNVTPAALPFFGAGPGATTAAAPSLSPFKEGALIRNKKDGKLYRVTNGVPVPEQESPAAATATEPTEADEEAQTQNELPMSDTPQEPEEE